MTPSLKYGQSESSTTSSRFMLSPASGSFTSTLRSACSGETTASFRIYHTTGTQRRSALADAGSGCPESGPQVRAHADTRASNLYLQVHTQQAYTNTEYITDLESFYQRHAAIAHDLQRFIRGCRSPRHCGHLLLSPQTNLLSHSRAAHNRLPPLLYPPPQETAIPPYHTR